MERIQELVDFAMEQAVDLLGVDSPSGYTKNAAERVMAAYRQMGYRPEMTVKGGVLVCLNPDAPEENGLLLEAHGDTLGGMVAEIMGNGRLRLTALGGMNPNNGEAENVRIVTRSGNSCPGWMSGCHLPLFRNCLSSFFSSGYPLSSSFITRRIFSPDSREATSSGRTRTYPFVPAI